MSSLFGWVFFILYAVVAIVSGIIGHDIEAIRMGIWGLLGIFFLYLIKIFWWDSFMDTTELEKDMEQKKWEEEYALKKAAEKDSYELSRKKKFYNIRDRRECVRESILMLLEEWDLLPGVRIEELILDVQDKDERIHSSTSVFREASYETKAFYITFVSVKSIAQSRIALEIERIEKLGPLSKEFVSEDFVRYLSRV